MDIRQMGEWAGVYQCFQKLSYIPTPISYPLLDLYFDYDWYTKVIEDDNDNVITYSDYTSFKGK